MKRIYIVGTARYWARLAFLRISSPLTLRLVDVGTRAAKSADFRHRDIAAQVPRPAPL
jgi:hypothetical protein